MKHPFVLILLLTLSLTCASFGAAQNGGQTPQPSDKNAQKQAERERKEAERKRKEEEKNAQQEAGVRCSRLRGK